MAIMLFPTLCFYLFLKWDSFTYLNIRFLMYIFKYSNYLHKFHTLQVQIIIFSGITVITTRSISNLNNLSHFV